jgi:hypothetical protein
MAISNEEKQQMLDALERSLYEGVLEVEYNDKRVRYRSFKEMQAIIDKLKIQLGKTAKTSKCFAKFDKGLC